MPPTTLLAERERIFAARCADLGLPLSDLGRSRFDSALSHAMEDGDRFVLRASGI